MEPIDVQRLLSLQQRKTEEWHEAAFTVSETGLLGLVEENHRCNYELWHEEDKARRDDRGYEYVYRAKRSIDRWNQRRNDVVERIDEWIAARAPTLAEGTPVNSETPGMIIDRLCPQGIPYGGGGRARRYAGKPAGPLP